MLDVRFREMVREETEIETLDSTVQRECLDMVNTLRTGDVDLRF